MNHRQIYVTLHAQHTTEWFIPNATQEAIEPMRPWHTVDVVGLPLADFIANATAEANVRRINADTTQAGGVRIRFSQHATYANLIAALDMMARLGQKKYLLDNHHNPTTLYAITTKLSPIVSAHSALYGECIQYNDAVIFPPMLTFWQLLATQLATLWQRAWRPVMLLFVVLSGLSMYRLIHLRGADR
ncbi:MAG: hypothetical protein ACRYG7_16285 [Janthinobacterium lividum]